MGRPTREIADEFDGRAPHYVRSSWHKIYAEGLVGRLPLRPGATVLDVGAGTGMATRPAARRSGPGGRVLAVDVSPAMLAALRTAPSGPGAAPIAAIRADASQLPLPDRSVDTVIASAVLLYLPVLTALTEWFRVLRPGGSVGCSTMAAGHPPAAALFRRLAASYGVIIDDPSADLGSSRACRAALGRAGFVGIEVTRGDVTFTADDLAGAREAHDRGFGHRLAVLTTAERGRFWAAYEAALSAEPASMGRAEVRYAVARRPAG